jgi:hypothetical protein
MKNLKKYFPLVTGSLAVIISIVLTFTACDNGSAGGFWSGPNPGPGSDPKTDPETDGKPSDPAKSGDIIIVGYYEMSGTKTAACCWKNGVKTDLPAPGASLTEAFGIVVIP